MGHLNNKAAFGRDFRSAFMELSSVSSLFQKNPDMVGAGQQGRTSICTQRPQLEREPCWVLGPGPPTHKVSSARDHWAAQAGPPDSISRMDPITLQGLPGSLKSFALRSGRSWGVPQNPPAVHPCTQSSVTNVNKYLPRPQWSPTNEGTGLSVPHRAGCGWHAP